MSILGIQFISKQSRDNSIPNPISMISIISPAASRQRPSCTQKGSSIMNLISALMCVDTLLLITIGFYANGSQNGIFTGISTWWIGRNRTAIIVLFHIPRQPLFRAWKYKSQRRASSAHYILLAMEIPLFIRPWRNIRQLILTPALDTSLKCKSERSLFWQILCHSS